MIPYNLGHDHPDITGCVLFVQKKSIFLENYVINIQIRLVNRGKGGV